MIRLLLFAPCERLLFSEQNSPSNTSLITVLESLSVRGEPTEEIRPDAALPKKWLAVALWHRTQEVEQPTVYQSKCELYAPDGQMLMGGNVEFTVSNEFMNFRNTVNFPVIPIGQSGIFSLKLFYKQSDAETWEQAGDFPLRILHEFERVNNDEHEATVENAETVTTDEQNEPV